MKNPVQKIKDDISSYKDSSPKRKFKLVLSYVLGILAYVLIVGACISLIAVSCSSMKSKKAMAAELPSGLYVADTYIGSLNGYETNYGVYFGFDSEDFKFMPVIFSYGSGLGFSSDVGDTIIASYTNGDYWGGPSDYYLIMFFSLSDDYDFSLTSSVSRSFFYNVSLSSSASEEFGDPAFDDLFYTLILYTFSDGVNSHDIEVYIPYSDLTRETIEAQQSAGSIVEPVTDTWSAIGSFVSDSIDNIVSVFYRDNALTFVGVLSVVALGISIFFLFLGLISNFLNLRG